MAALAVARSSSHSVDLTAPETLGTHYYGACVEAVADESDATNNCSASVEVDVQDEQPVQSPDLEGQPDLNVTVTDESVSDSRPITGTSFTLSATVRNDGDGAAAATTLRYYRSTDATITTTDTQVGTDDVGALAAAGSNAESISLTAPATAGPYYYGACVDAVTDESDTTNNCSSSVKVDVEEPTYPDLEVGTPGVDDTSPETGATITLSATVSNGGDARSLATTLRYYRSTDATITTTDTQVGTDDVGALAAAGSSAESISLTVPATAGAYYYGACVDAVTDESDTTDNCSSSVKVDVEEPTYPDLEVGTPGVDDTSPETGATITLSATVSNGGDARSPATTLRYYRSSDATITTADTQVGTDDVGALAAAGSSAESISLTVPATAGPYYYGACVDAVTDESDTTNNCSASVQVTVQTTVTELQGDPDLTVISPSVSDSDPAAGAAFTLSATVSNGGDARSPATTLRYYRSSDATITTADTSVGTDSIAGLAASGSAGASVELTASTTAGTYYYGACVDAVTDESDTTNNCSASVQVTVPEPKHPDLTVTSPSVSDSDPAAGAAFTLSATVRNAGDGEGEVTTLRYYRSSDATITTADTSVGTDTVAKLAASGTSSQSVELTAPATPGTYYYGACVDAVTGESDTTNNCSASVQVTVPEPKHPDLTVTSPSVSDSDPAAGAAFTLSATVKNAGDGEAEGTTLRYYRSSDATITTADTSVGTDTVAKLAASGTSSQSVDLTAPSTPGTYYYGACVDAVTGESDTTNNCSASVPVTVPAPKPDLVVGSPSVDDSSPAPGEEFTLSATVKNAGGGAAASTTLRYYRSTDATITTSDTEVGTDSVDGLAAAGTSSQSVDLTAPSTPGTYYYGACVDAVTDESDTTNNCSTSVPVTVPAPKPDLVVGSPSVDDSSPAAGAAFTLSATVENGGGGAAASTTLRYYRSTDATITTSDTEVGTDSVDGLAAAGTSSQSVDLTAPSTPGTYYYGACVDAVTDESDTTNNCSTSVPVTVPAPKPDLVVGSPSVDDSSPAAGAAFTLSATVENGGGGAAASTTLRYYRSTDATITTSDTEVSTDSVDGLAAAGTSTRSVALTAPSKPGTYYYGACVDAVTGESDTTNNCSASVQVTVPEPQVRGPQPDLLVVWGFPSVSYPAVGAQITLSATVRNAGDAASAATTLRYHQSRSGDKTTTPVGTDAIAALDASKHSKESVDVTAPSTPGTYLYQACVDAVANESDTTNNCGSFNQVTVLAKAAAKVELTPSSVSFTEIGATETLTIRVLDTDGDEISPNSLGWSSEDKTVATVSGGLRQTIRVKAIGAGTTTVTVTANDGVTGTAAVTVTPTGRRVEVSPNSLTFTALGDSKTVTVRVLDENDEVDSEASYSWFGLTYPGSTVDLERVTGGLKVTATEGGGGEFEITSTGASPAILLVRVSQQPASVKVSPSSVSLAPGKTATMSVRVADANDNEIAVAGTRGRIVYWTTSNSAVAKIAGERRLREGYETGATATVTAGTAGTATITARPGGETVEGTATVTVTTQQNPVDRLAVPRRRNLVHLAHHRRIAPATRETAPTGAGCGGSRRSRVAGCAARARRPGGFAVRCSARSPEGTPACRPAPGLRP